ASMDRVYRVGDRRLCGLRDDLSWRPRTDADDWLSRPKPLMTSNMLNGQSALRCDRQRPSRERAELAIVNWTNFYATELATVDRSPGPKPRILSRRVIISSASPPIGENVHARKKQPRASIIVGRDGRGHDEPASETIGRHSVPSRRA